MSSSSMVSRLLLDASSSFASAAAAAAAASAPSLDFNTAGSKFLLAPDMQAFPKSWFRSVPTVQIEEPVLKRKAIDMASQQDIVDSHKNRRKQPPMSSTTEMHAAPFRFDAGTLDQHFAEAVAAVAAAAGVAVPIAASILLSDPLAAKDSETSKRPSCATMDQTTTVAAAAAASVGIQEETEEEWIRRRNRAYSRRKYERKKVEVQVLHEENQRLLDENVNLRREQEHLEHLIVQARACLHQARRFSIATTTTT
jgi:hypothetical protein